MAPDLVNKLDHPVRVQDENGQTVRVVPGQVVSVDGVAADRLNAIEGLDSASSDDRDAWDARNAQPSDVTSGKGDLEQSFSDLRVEARTVGTAVPLNQVIGDDDAPLGPPSGTITTKQAVARLSPEQKAAYADHERLPEEAENEKLSEVERAQAEAKAVVEEAHNTVLDAAAEGGHPAATTSPQLDTGSTGRKSRKKASSADEST